MISVLSKTSQAVSVYVVSSTYWAVPVLPKNNNEVAISRNDNNKGGSLLLLV